MPPQNRSKRLKTPQKVPLFVVAAQTVSSLVVFRLCRESGIHGEQENRNQERKPPVRLALWSGRRKRAIGVFFQTGGSKWKSIPRSTF